MTESKDNEFVKMLDEIRAVRDKYGLPKGIVFVPDKLEISLKRNSYDSFHLSYKERFEYLPNEILDIVVPISINLLVARASDHTKKPFHTFRNGKYLEKAFSNN